MNRLAPQKESVDMTFPEKLFEKLKTMKEKKDSILVPEEKQIDELSKKTLGNYIKHSKDDLRANASIGGEDRVKNKKTDSETARTIANRSYGINKAVDKLTKEESELDEALGKDAEASDWIDDFVHSKNPKFAGKSKEERKKQALAAYYGKKNESIEDSEDDDTNKHDIKSYNLGFQHGTSLRDGSNKNPHDRKKNPKEHRSYEDGYQEGVFSKQDDFRVHEEESTTDTLAGRSKGKLSKFVKPKVELDSDDMPEDREGKSDDEHDDEEQDKKMVKGMVKPSCLTTEQSVLKKIREVSSKAHKNVKETLGIASRSEVHEEDEQLAEDSKLDQWLNSIGVNPDHLTRERKIGYARSPAFQNWQRSH
jgi:hypothetical protein